MFQTVTYDVGLSDCSHLHHEFDRRHHMIKLFCGLNVKKLNILHWKSTIADKFSSHFCQNGFYQRRINFDEKFTTAERLQLLPVFLENSEPKSGQEHKFTQFWNELLYQLIILLNKPYFGLLCANYVVWKFTGDL